MSAISTGWPFNKPTPVLNECINGASLGICVSGANTQKTCGPRIDEPHSRRALLRLIGEPP
jgi:hypothetical protein